MFNSGIIRNFFSLPVFAFSNSDSCKNFKFANNDNLDSETIKIGAIYDLSGEQAPLDIPSARGAELAVKRINSSGGILGKKIELLLYDGKTDLKNISLITEKLSAENKVSAIIGFSDTNQVMAAAPFSAKHGIPFITSGATSPKLPSQIPGWLFMACFGDNVQAAAGAEFAVKNLNSKSAYLLVQNDMEFTLLLAKYFKESYKSLGGKIISEDNFKSGDKDFSSLINKLKSNIPLPDILYISAGPEEIGEIVKQIREANLSQPIIGGDSYDSTFLIEKAGKSADNIYFTTHCLIDTEHASSKIRKFISDYKENFNNELPHGFAALGYDTINLVANAIKTANSTDPNFVRDALIKTKNLPGISGEITFQSGNPIPQKSVTVVKIEKGKFKFADEIIPDYFPES